MSVLVLGGDDITSIKAVLQNLGCEDIVHWSGRKKSVTFKSIPQKVECVLMLTGRLTHNLMIRFKNESKKKNIPFVCAKYDASSVYQEWTKKFGEPESCTNCGECKANNENINPLFGDSRV